MSASSISRSVRTATLLELFWLLAGLGAIYWLARLSAREQVSFVLGLSPLECGALCGACLVFLSSGAMTYFRSRNHAGAARALIWLGHAVAGFILAGSAFEAMGYRMTGASGFGVQGGLLAAFLITVSGVWRLYRRRRGLSGSEVAIYWIGLTAANVFFLGFLLLINPDWVQSDLNAGALGALIALVIGILVAICVLLARWGRARPMELSVYCAGNAAFLFFANILLQHLQV